MSTTSENNKRIARNTAFLYIRMLLIMFVTLYTSRVVLQALGITDYGIYSVVGGIVAMFSFINSAMTSATQRYITFELGRGNALRLKEVFSTSINIHATISLMIIILAETIGLWFLKTKMTIPIERVNASLWVYHFSVLSCIIMVMSVPYNATIVAHEKMKAFAFISILEVILKLVIVYILLIYIFDVDRLKLYAVLMFSVQLISRLVYGYYCKKNFEETKYKWYWNKTLLKEMTYFAGWSLFGNLAAISFTQGINLLLNIFFGPIVNAARGVAVQVQMAVQSFCMNFQMALNPQITKTYATNDLYQMHKLIFASSKYSFFLLFLLSFPIMIETEYILSIWLEEIPDHTVTFVRLILCVSMIDALSNPLGISSQATGHIRNYQIIIGGILLLIVPISYILLRLGGLPECVFIVHLIIALLAQFVRILLVRSMIKLSIKQYFVKVIYKIVVVVLFSSIIPLIIYQEVSAGWTRLLLICAVSFFSVLIVVYWIGFEKNEKVFVRDKIRFLLKRKI